MFDKVHLYVQIRGNAFSPVIQIHHAQADKVKVPLQSVETCQSIESLFRLIFRLIFNNVPNGEFLCLQKCNGTQVNTRVNVSQAHGTLPD